MNILPNNRRLKDPTYLTPFFIGLFEGGGGFYFRKTKIAGNSQFRVYFLIKLDPYPENKVMLELINQCLGLKASIYHKTSSTLGNPAKMVMHGGSAEAICQMLTLLETYPLLTSKKVAQLKEIQCNLIKGNLIKDPKVDATMNDKAFKKEYIEKQNQTFIKPAYFNTWLSGFLESKIGLGTYTREYRVFLSITDDWYLIQAIQNKFQSDRKIKIQIKGDQSLYRLDLCSRQAIKKVIEHIEHFPFLGYTQVRWETFCTGLEGRPERNSRPVPKLLTNNLTETKVLQKKSIDVNYLEPFFVGLLEGDGAVVLGRTKGGRLSYGFFQIRLKYNPENHRMLDTIRQYIGGTIHYSHRKNGNDQITWTAAAQKDVRNMHRILDKYPLLTSRKICQLHHLKQCEANRDWDYHLQTRDSKYEQQQNLIRQYKQNFVIPSYFGPWVSGFFEAEGSFRSAHGLSAYICQNDDWYILNAIKYFFNSHHKLGKHKDLRPNCSQHQYRLSMSGKPVLSRVIAHFEAYPLLGYKKVSYDLFCNKIYR